MSVTAAIGKYALRALGALLLLIVLLALAIQIPAVQTWIAQQATGYLAQQVETPIRIERVRISLLSGTVSLGGLYVEDQQRDTLLMVEELGVSIRLADLLSKKVTFDHLLLRQSIGKMYPVKDTIMNYQFLVDAFSSGEPKTEPSGTPWTIGVADAGIRLQDIRFFMALPDSALALKLDLGGLAGGVKQADINRMRYDLSAFSLRDTEVALELGGYEDQEVEDPDTASSAAVLAVWLEEMELANIRYAMKMPGLELSSRVGHSFLRDLDFGMAGDSLAFQAPAFTLDRGSFRYDVPDSARLESGFDYNHLAFDSIQLRLADASYDNTVIDGRVEQLAATDPGGFSLTELRGLAHFEPDSMTVQDLVARTGYSSLDLPFGALEISGTSEASSSPDLEVEVDLRGARVSPYEIAYFVPALAEVDWINDVRQPPFELHAQLDGSLQAMDISRFDLSGWGVRLNVFGQLGNLSEPERLRARLDIDPFSVRTDELRQHLPDSLWPSSADLPQELWTRARLNGSVDSMNLELLAQTSRPDYPVTTRLDLQGYATDLLDPQALRYHLEIDTLLLMQEELRAQLAAQFPDSISLPASVALQAVVTGGMDSVYAERLALTENRDSAGIRLGLHGGVGFPEEENPLRFDLQVDSLYAPAKSIAAWLPDSTLPASLQTPDIERLQASIVGSTRDLEGMLSADIQKTHIEAQAFLRDTSYDARLTVDSFLLVHWLSPALFDSVIGLELVPLALGLHAQGAGFELGPDLQATLTADLRVQDTSAYSWNNGLVLVGAAEGYTATLGANIREQGAQGQLTALANLHPDSSTLLEASLILDMLDLQALRLSAAPAKARGSFHWRSRGDSLDDIELDAGLEGLQFVYDTLQGELSQLEVQAKYQDRQAELALQSSVAQGTVVGQFDLEGIAGDIRQTLQTHFIPRGTRDTLPGQPGDYLQGNISIADPGLLTGGLIPGLRQLDTGNVSIVYSRDERLIDLQLDFPHIAYKSFAVDHTAGDFFANDTTLRYGISFSRLTGPSDFETINFDLSGEVGPEATTINVLRQQNAQGEDRFLVKADLRRTEGTTFIRFHPDLLLNYENWSMTEGNQLAIRPEGVTASDWRLSREEQAVILQDSLNGQDIRLSLQRFQLALLGNSLRAESNLLGGEANGAIVIHQVLSTPRVEAHLDIDSLQVFEAALGRADLDLVQEDSMAWKTALGLQGAVTNLNLEGYYRPLAEETISLNLRCDPLDLGPLVPVTFGAVADMSGLFYTDLTIVGTLESPKLDGIVRFENASVTPALLNTPFKLGNETINFATSQGSRGNTYTADFGSWRITDADGQVAVVSGGMRAIGFEEYQIDMEFKAERFLVMDNTEEDNELFFGHLNLNLDGAVTGRLDSIDLQLLVEPTDESTFTYVSPVNTLANTESWDNIITFETDEAPDSSLAFFPTRLDTIAQTTSELGLYLTINASLNEDLEFTLITDPVAGDNFQGMVEGDLVVTMYPRSDLELVGQMNVLEGEYLFTYTELIKRRFSVLPSSTISWTGDPMEPQLNVAAVYTTKARPTALVAKYSGVPSGEAAGRLSQRQEFNVVFRVEGELDDFSIDTDIEYPRNNFNNNLQEINNAIETLNQDESETNSQAFSLLLFNSFLATENASATSGLINLQQSFSDIITGYLNSLADQYVNFIEIDIDLESSGQEMDSYIQDTDLRVSLRKRFFNDRLEIRVDGVASSGDEGTSSSDDNELQAYLDNITVEYSLNQQGSLKIRVYNEREAQDLLGGDVVKLGGGLVFSKSFNRLNIFGPKKSAEPPPDRIGN